MLELNVVNLTKLTHLFGKEMKSRRSGSILNVGSTAGMIPLARFAAYGASKSYINTFSFALRAEMAPYNVNVTCLIPTAVATNFAQTANIASFVGKSVLKDLFAQGKVSRTDKVAEAGYQALRQKKASIVTGNGAWLVRFFFRVMSQSMLPVLFKDM